MSSILDAEVEVAGLEGVKLKRLNMIQSLTIQKKVVKTLSGINVDLKGTDTEQAIKVLTVVYDNVELVVDIIKMVTGKTGKELEKLPAGAELDIIMALKDHPDVKMVISKLKSAMGNLMPKVKNPAK